MKKVLVSPSILGVSKENLSSTCLSLLEKGSDLIHFDVMDGNFVSNISFMEDEIDIVSNTVNKRCLDVHLMCKPVEIVVDDFMKKRVKYITFHYEAVKKNNIEHFISYIKDKGFKCGISLNPQTDIKKLTKYLHLVDLVLVMSVVPGKGGQAFMESSLEKIKYLDSYRKKKKLRYLIEVDGGINEQTSKLCKEVGVDILVAGSYILKSENYEERIKSLK